MDLDVAAPRLDHHGRNDLEPVRFWFSGQRGWQSDGIPLFPKPFLFLERRPNVDPRLGGNARACRRDGRRSTLRHRYCTSVQCLVQASGTRSRMTFSASPASIRSCEMAELSLSISGSASIMSRLRVVDRKGTRLKS